MHETGLGSGFTQHVQVNANTVQTCASICVCGCAGASGRGLGEGQGCVCYVNTLKATDMKGRERERKRGLIRSHISSSLPAPPFSAPAAA